ELLPLAARRFAQVVGERERAAALLAALDCEGYVLARWSVDAIVECERQLAIRLALQIDRRRTLQCQCPELRARPRREPRVLLGGTVNGGNGERTGGGAPDRTVQGGTLTALASHQCPACCRTALREVHTRRGRGLGYLEVLGQRRELAVVGIGEAVPIRKQRRLRSWIGRGL